MMRPKVDALLLPAADATGASRASCRSTPDEVMSVLVGMVREPGVERDVVGSVALSMESEDADDDSDEVAESRTGEEVENGGCVKVARVTAGNTRIQAHIS